MNFVADESCAGGVIGALREAGHDVPAVAEVWQGASEEQVLRGALDEKRVLTTEDRDWGVVVFARGRPSAGVILVRFHNQARQAKPDTVVDAVSKLGRRLRIAFTLIEPGRVRINDMD